MKLDMEKLKAETKALAISLKERPASDPVDWPERRVKRFTQLCALRASLRGRLHFALDTNLAEACWIFEIPCLMCKDIKDPDYYNYKYLTITLEIQEKWVAEIMEEFALEESEAAA